MDDQTEILSVNLCDLKIIAGPPEMKLKEESPLSGLANNN
jgi:hypothetical protein